MTRPYCLSSRRLMPLAAIGAMAGLGLAACSTTAPTVEVEGAVASSAPLPQEGYDWHLNSDDSEISLAYGMADTDDVPLDLSCEAGSKSLNLLLNVEKGHPLRIDLESGGDTQTYRAMAEPSPMTDGVDLTATVRSDDPVFLRFRKLGWLAVHTGENRRPLVATPAALPQIARFFEICEQAR